MSEDVRKRLAELESASLEGGGKERRQRAGTHFRRVRGARGVICAGWVVGVAQGPPAALHAAWSGGEP